MSRGVWLQCQKLCGEKHVAFLLADDIIYPLILFLFLFIYSYTCSYSVRRETEVLGSGWLVKDGPHIALMYTERGRNGVPMKYVLRKVRESTYKEERHRLHVVNGGCNVFARSSQADMLSLMKTLYVG